MRSNLELDRARRTRRRLERSRTLLDQAQRLARVGSWEIDLASGTVEASDEFLRIMGRTADEVAAMGYDDIVGELIHPEDQAMVQRALDEADGTRHPLRVPGGAADGETVLVSVYGEVVLDEHGEREALRGSVQDITERRAAEEALALAAANAEAAAREHAIADQLQRSLLPQQGFDLDHLEVATYYRAGVEGTQVGGDWYDVIELGGGRTALVVGDVMGRGVRAAAVMGQLRSAVRAYARLDLPPADLLESLDGLVREIGEDQIVTCIYAVFDPADRVLRFANAGHLPPIVAVPGGECRVVGGDENPPLGRRAVQPDPAHGRPRLQRTRGALHRRPGRAARRGPRRSASTTLAGHVAALDGPVDGVPEELVAAMLPDGPDDDVAILVARVDPPSGEESLSRRIDSDQTAVADARHLVTSYLEARGDAGACWSPTRRWRPASWSPTPLVHGRPPIELRLRLEGARRAHRGRATGRRTSRASCAPTRTTSTAAACRSSPRSRPGGAPGRPSTARPSGASSARWADPGAAHMTLEIRLPLRFRDVDAFGHVYHAEYLTLLDEARTRWFRDAVALDEPGAYVVARIEIDYVSSLVLDDAEVVATFAVERVGTSSVTLAETLSAPDGRVAARIRSVTVRHDLAAGRSRPLTDAEKDRLAQP